MSDEGNEAHEVSPVQDLCITLAGRIQTRNCNFIDHLALICDTLVSHFVDISLCFFFIIVCFYLSVWAPYGLIPADLSW